MNLGEYLNLETVAKAIQGEPLPISLDRVIELLEQERLRLLAEETLLELTPESVNSAQEVLLTFNEAALVSEEALQAMRDEFEPPPFVGRFLTPPVQAYPGIPDGDRTARIPFISGPRHLPCVTCKYANKSWLQSGPATRMDVLRCAANPTGEAEECIEFAPSEDG